MRFSAAVLLLCFAVVVRAEVRPEASQFTAKELAQGYRDHFILAKPKASHRGSADAEEAREGIRVRDKLPRIGDLRIVELDPTDNPAAAIGRLRDTGRYEFVEPDYIRHITATTPDDVSYADGSLWGLNNSGVNNGIPGADISAARAWDIVHDASNVLVAVIDTGVNINHPDLAGNIWTNPAPTFGDVHGARIINLAYSGDPTDDNGHGTHVAGTIGAIGNNSLGVTGVAWHVRILPIKVFPSSGGGSVSDIARGIQYAIDKHADVINASYGESGSTGYSSTELSAMQAARDAGIIIVAAAGNASANMDVTPFYPASHALDNIVTVGASTRRDEVANFSNFGAAVDLYAPGSEIVSLSYSNTTAPATLSGTSMAAPHVTGAVALLKAEFPNDNYHQIINRLRRGVDRNPLFAGKAQTSGRLNLYKALTTQTNRPFNDDFEDRPRLNSDNLSVRADNTGATSQSNEPLYSGLAASGSLWWEWVSPITGTVSVDTAGSSYDTRLAIFTGSSLGALSLVTENDDGATTRARLSFAAHAGTAYQIAVDGKSGGSGLTLLKLGSTPANDLFATPVILDGNSARVTATNLHCSREAGEPTLAGVTGGLSLWYRWTAPRSGTFQIAAVNNDFDPVLGVFTGSSVSSLVRLTDNRGIPAGGALCTINATAGTTYQIALDAPTVQNVGTFTLTLVDSLWQSAATNSITSPPSVGPDGTVYVGSTDNTLYAFNPDGTTKWKYATTSSIDGSSAAIATDGTIYIASGFTGTGALDALKPDGSVRWHHLFGASIPAANSPAIGADGTIYIKPSDGYLYALNPADGTQKWRADVHGPTSYSSPTIAPDGTIYVGSEDKHLYAINPNGTQKWSFLAESDVYTTPAIDAAGNVYFGVLNTGKFYSVRSDGSLRWTYAGASLGTSSSPALSADGATVYFAGYDSKLHAVDTTTGTKRWAYPLGAEVRSSSPAVDASGVIYVGCYDYKLYAINADGTLKRTYDSGNWIRSSPVIAGHTLYVGSNDFKLYAFDIGTSVAAGPWPQYRHNVRHLGRAVTAPSVSLVPLSQSVSLGSSVVLTTAATGDATTTYQWERNGVSLANGTSATFTLPSVQPTNTGLYAGIASNSGIAASATPAIVGLSIGTKLEGAGSEVGTDIVHPNHNIYDQVLLQGAAVSVRADKDQVVRISFVDLTDDIVQVEFAGAGTLSLVLDSPSGPALAQNYNQPDVTYMKGHPGIVITGADETTNISVFSVGKLTAFNQALFRSDVAYDGMADISYIAILSSNGKFGGLRAADANFFSTHGLTGVYAPNVRFTGDVFIGDIAANDAASPAILLGASDLGVKITGGDLFQPNNHAVQVSGISQLKFVAGTTSQDHSLPAQLNRGRLEENGLDVTSQVVVNPTQ